MKVMTLNCGSSSVKYAVWEMPQCDMLCSGIVERVTVGGSFIRHQLRGKPELREDYECPNHNTAINLIVKYLMDSEWGVIKDIKELKAVGHRAVHGGERYTRSVLIDQNVINTIKEFSVLAPLHNPANLMGITASMEVFPHIPHIACWDTCFSTAFMPQKAYIYAIPYEYYKKHRIRRYGYHGISHLYVAKRAAVLLGKKPLNTNLISLHIGNGVSITAVKDGIACDQSLGYSTCGEGPVMGTRCGDLDPIIPLTLMKMEGLSIKEVEDVLYHKSGILGLSGRYIDRRDIIEAAAKGDQRSRLAFEIECYRLKKYIGAYAAILGRLDAVVFTAGVGESSPSHREQVCEGLEILGIQIDPGKNQKAVGRQAGETDISASDSKVRVLVIPANEELVMAVDTAAILEGNFDEHTKFEYPFEKEDFVPTYL